MFEIKNISQGLLTDRHFRISDLEDTAREIIQNKTQKKKKTEINISKMWDNLQVVEEPGNGEWDKKYI